ncbi:MAG: DUF6249 domain-containing protein [Candidatus Zixiibacteriota bacterium]|jgi:hypothetical protein
MKKLFAMTLAAALLALVLVGPALAQPPEKEGSGEKAGTVERPPMKPGKTAEEDREIIIKKMRKTPDGRRVRELHPGMDGPCVPGEEPEIMIHRERAILPIFGMLIPLLLILGITAIVVVAIFVGHRSARLRYEVIQLALKENRDIPNDLLRPRRHDAILPGLILTALGLALGIALGVAAAPVYAVWGLIPLFMGLAMLIYGPVRRKMTGGDD